MSTIDEIKSRIDIVDLVSETVKLRHSGKNYTGFCPFHANTRTPAFVVFPDSGTWRCFGACNEGGDIFRYVMKREGWDFAQALRYLAEKAGVQLEPLTPERQVANDYQDKLRELLEQSANYYRHQLTQTPGGKPALEYLVKRGLSMESITRFGLGYAPDSWDALQKHLLGRSWTADDLTQAGLVSERDSGGTYDRFRNRIMFPIRDAMGHMTGFGARILDPNDVPKFLNSPQTALFDKGHLLYGLDLARKAIRSENQAVIVEGYLDVIALHQQGFANAVSPMGTALTEIQMRLVKRFSNRIVLALDADAAGQKATLRGLEIARQAMDHSTELGFDPRGLLRQEARLQADLRVTTLPSGEDPDDVVLRDPEEWRKILEAAQPVVIHVMETIAAGRNINDPRTRSEIAGVVLPLIEDIPNAVERESYRQRLARLLKVDERALIATTTTSRRTRPGSPQVNTGAPAAVTHTGSRPITASLEEHSLHLLLCQPDILYRLDRSLQKHQLSRFAPEDFEQADHQLLARLVVDSLEQDKCDPVTYLAENIPESLSDLAAQLMEPLPRGDPEGDKLVEELVRTVVRLRLIRVRQALNHLRFMQQDLQEQGETSLGNYQELVMQYSQTKARLEMAEKYPFQSE